jgi:hypothetical protein
MRKGREKVEEGLKRGRENVQKTGEVSTESFM